MNGSIELLAPAGSIEAAYAALEYGADAIYLGLPSFSARAEAINFTLDEFYDITGYAHTLGCKVYVTLNTLIKDSELEVLLPLIQHLEQAEADAVIVQDLGVLRIIREYFPTLSLHASTQMAIHNRLGAEYLLKLGVKRVTLARELSIQETGEIATIPGLETEAFIHGALCYSYSGLCMYSSMQTGRSANRGRCAYSCREIFSCPELGLSGHAFSLRDLSLTHSIDKLLQSGVDSLKLEGRKKSALYVAAVVRLYRGILDRTSSTAEIEAHTRDLKTIFSRENTGFFAAGEADPAGRSNSIDTAAVGHRGAEIGRVEAIQKRGRDEHLVFTTFEDFEKHDGIQVDIPGTERPYGFPVNELYRLNNNQLGRALFTINKGETAAITLPADHPVLPLGSPVYLASSQRVKRELKWHTPKAGEHRQGYPITIELSVNTNTLILQATIEQDQRLKQSLSQRLEYTAASDFETAQRPEQSRNAAHKIFNKTGATPFTLSNLELKGDHTRFIPASILNQLRRELYTALESELHTYLDKTTLTLYAEICSEPEKAAETDYPTDWLLKTDSPISIYHVDPGLASQIEEVIIELNENTHTPLLLEELQQIQTVFKDSRLRLALPTICRNSRLRNIAETVSTMLKSGFSSWQINNLWGLQLLTESGITDIAGASSLYTLNQSSIAEQQTLGLSWSTLSVEDELENLHRLIQLAGERLCLPVYQDTPLFIGEACSYSSFQGNCPEDCREINNHRIWKDRRGNSFTLKKHGCRSILLNNQAFSLSGRLNASGLKSPRYLQADFINRDYTADEINFRLQALFSDNILAHTHSGNFQRRLL